MTVDRSGCQPIPNPEIVGLIGGLDTGMTARLQEELGREILRVEGLPVNPNTTESEWAAIVMNTTSVHWVYIRTEPDTGITDHTLTTSQ